LEHAGPIRRVAEHLRVVAVPGVVDKIGRDGSVADIAGRDSRVGDDLAVGIDRDMAFAPIEASRSVL